jgi:hypothetical protein
MMMTTRIVRTVIAERPAAETPPPPPLDQREREAMASR